MNKLEELKIAADTAWFAYAYATCRETAYNAFGAALDTKAAYQAELGKQQEK
jgi:hypothetical protein